MKPLLAFTDPTTSDTGRAVLLTLYAMAADKAPEDLTARRCRTPDVVAYVKHFQSLVDHYMVSTIPLNTKVHQGPRYGHFFIMPEDNLIHLIDGTEPIITIDGVEGTAPPLEYDMVMIYPKEGSLLRENCACAVKATGSPRAARRRRGVVEVPARRQAAASLHGRRLPARHQPAGQRSRSVPVRPYGLPTPSKVLNAERMPPAIAQAIDDAWEDVKRPASSPGSWTPQARWRATSSRRRRRA